MGFHCTISKLSNYLTTFYIFSDNKFKTIHDILMEQIQFSYPVHISVTLTCQKNLLTSVKHKITINTKYIIPVNLAMLYGKCYLSDQQRQYHSYLLDQQRQYQSSVYQNTCYMCKNSWFINYMNYYDSHLHLPFQLQLLQDVDQFYLCLPLRYLEPLHHSAL